MAVGALTLANPSGVPYALPAGNSPYGVTAFGNNVYVCMTQTGSSGIVQLTSDQTTGALSQVAAMVATTNGPRRCRVAPDGKNLYVAVSGYSDLYTFTRSATDGSLSGSIRQAQATTPVDATLSSPTDVDISPDNAHVYVANSYNNGAGGGVMVYSRATNGALTAIQRFALTGAWAVRCAPDGNSIYVASQTSNTLYKYARDNNPASGTYGQIGALIASIATPSTLPACIDVTDDGKYIYVADDQSGQGYTGCFFWDATAGAFVDRSFRTTNTDTNGGPWWLALSRDAGNTTLYVALSDAQRISQYKRNADGSISLLTPGSATTSYYTAGTPHGSGGPNGIAVSPSNKFLYAPNVGSNTVDVFTIEQAAAAATVTSVSVTPANPTVQGGTTQQFSATVAGTNSPAQTVTWSKTGAGSIDASGLYTAPAATASAQTATITATSTVDGTKSGSATVTIPAQAPAVTHAATVTLGNASGAIANRSGLLAHVFTTANMGTANATDATGKLALDVTSLGITGTAYVAVVDPATGEHWAGQVTVS